MTAASSCSHRNATVAFNGTRTVTLTNNNTYLGGTAINSGTWAANARWA